MVDTMIRNKVTDNGSSIDNDLEATKCADDQFKPFKSGDLVWIRTHDFSWWPAQVVDEEDVGYKPKKKPKDGVLVRLYGCYEHLYVDLVKCGTEFKQFLKEHNLSMKEAFQKVLDEDLSRVRSRGKSERKISEARDVAATNGSKGKKRRQDNTKIVENNPLNAKCSIPEVPSPNLSERRLKVMQNLGLIAPLGSPYRRNGFIIASPLKET